jgi:hypothetical protein
MRPGRKRGDPRGAGVVDGGVSHPDGADAEAALAKLDWARQEPHNHPGPDGAAAEGNYCGIAPYELADLVVRRSRCPRRPHRR